MPARPIAFYTLLWLVIYVPAETFITVGIAGLGGLLDPAFVLNAVGMTLLYWGAMTGLRERAIAPAALAIAWSWTAATMWRATADRFWWVSLGRELFFGERELWAGPLITTLAVLPLIASMRLLVRQHRTGRR